MTLKRNLIRVIIFSFQGLNMEIKIVTRSVKFIITPIIVCELSFHIYPVFDKASKPYSFDILNISSSAGLVCIVPRAIIDFQF